MGKAGNLVYSGVDLLKKPKRNTIEKPHKKKKEEKNPLKSPPIHKTRGLCPL